jgi:hypothetical protein
MTHPHTDLIDLLRLACSTGKLRLNVWHSAKNGYQANLARNSTDGWTVEHDKDPLKALEKALRAQHGGWLDRLRAEEAALNDPRQIDIEEAIAAAASVEPERKRYLCHHPESGALFEAYPFETDGLVEDVTGIPEYEDRWTAMQTAEDDLAGLIG